uniref:Uncharacterized protein n=1 Tax=Meloidogyne enterolobii TaxID=390850 RepID=A0A6V7VFR1_MELEN|nr:unnamed protein product [Meloidogyne enterolobii]
MSSPTHNCCHPKQQQLQTTAGELASVMQELLQRFDKPTDKDDVPVQPVQKEEQKELLSFFQRRQAFWEECLKRLGLGIIERIQMRSATELLSDREMFPTEEWCDRPSSQYDCLYGCSQHTQSCPSVFVYSPEEMKLAVEWDSEIPDFLKEKSMRETMENLGDEEKLSEYSDEAIDQRVCSDQHLAEFDSKQQPQTTTEDLTSVMQELRQRFDNRVNQNPVPAQSVQKEEQKEQLNYCQRKDASVKKYGHAFWAESAHHLLSDRKKPPTRRACRRVGPQYDCFSGCHHTKSCPGLFEYSPELMKFIADCEARTRHRHATFSIKKSKLETVEECDEEGQLSSYSVEATDRPSCSSRRLIARSYDYLTPTSLDAVTASGRGDKAEASSLTSSSDDYFGQSSENFSLEPLLGSLEDINSTKTCLQAETCLPTTMHKKFYFLEKDFLEKEWCSSLADVTWSWERRVHTMEELDPEKWQLLEYAARPFALLDDFSTGSEYSDSSIRAYVSSLSPLEAREKVRKLALQANNVDDFFELIPDNLLDNFFSDYKMLVQHKMLEEQCDNIREELMKQPKKADD